MERQQLVEQFYALTETERYRQQQPETGPSRFYRFLEEHGYLESGGIYHMPSIFFAYQEQKTPENLSECIDYSPYQSLFRMKKATRFSSEPLSYADFLCIRYVYSGEVVMTTPKDSFVLKQNDILLMNAGFVQSQTLAHEEDISFTLMFEKDYLVKNVLNSRSGSNLITRFMYSYVLNSERPQNYILFHGGSNDKLPRLMEDIVMEYADPSELGQILLEAYLQILLVEMTRSPYEFEENRESRQSLHFAQIMDEIDANYTTVTLQDLAQRYSYHPDYISRQIRTLTGRSFRDYVTDKRMEQVCMLLRNSDLPISQIQQQAGFPNETYFYRKFRERYGVTPREYRDEKV